MSTGIRFVDTRRRIPSGRAEGTCLPRRADAAASNSGRRGPGPGNKDLPNGLPSGFVGGSIFRNRKAVVKSGDLDWSDETADGLVLVRLGLALFAFLLGLPLLLWFCWLRETPIFWRNVGGYPVWFRELVLEAYYPVFGLNAAVMFLYFYLILRVPPRTQRSLRINLAVLSLMATALAGAVLFTVADDIEPLLR